MSSVSSESDTYFGFIIVLLWIKYHILHHVRRFLLTLMFMTFRHLSFFFAGECRQSVFYQVFQLTHWSCDKMANTVGTIFLINFSCMQINFIQCFLHITKLTEVEDWRFINLKIKCQNIAPIEVSCRSSILQKTDLVIMGSHCIMCVLIYRFWVFKDLTSNRSQEGL